MSGGCTKCLKKLFSPISGKGVVVKFKKGTQMLTVNSFYYWEFMIYFQKMVLLAMVSYMNDYNEGIQITLILALLAMC